MALSVLTASKFKADGIHANESKANKFNEIHSAIRSIYKNQQSFIFVGRELYFNCANKEHDAQ